MDPERELGELLRRAAAEPARPFDRGDVARRARRVRRTRRLATAASTLAAVTPLALLGQLMLPPDVHVRFGSGTIVSIERAVTVSPSPPASPTPEPGATASLPSPPDTSPPGHAPEPTEAPTAGVRPTPSSHATVVIKDPPGAPERRPALPGDRRHPDIVLTLVLERTAAAQGGSWKGRLEARNTGTAPADLGDARCWAVWGLYRDGQWVGGQADSTCGKPHPASSLPPGATLRLPLTFDTVAGDERDEPAMLAPGRYHAAAGLRVESGEHPYDGVWYAPAVEFAVSEAEPATTPSG